MALFALLNRGQGVVCATLDLDGLKNYQYVAFEQHFLIKIIAYNQHFVENTVAFGQHFVFRNVKTFGLFLEKFGLNQTSTHSLSKSVG